MAIPLKVIQGAAQGSIDDLLGISGQLNVQNFSFAVFEAPVKVLRNWDLPSASTTDIVIRLRLPSAISALQCLHAVMLRMKAKAVGLLYDSLEAIIGWFSSCILLIPRYYTHDLVKEYFGALGAFLGTLIWFEESDKLAKPTLSSRAVVKAVLFIWSLPHSDDSQELYHGWGGKHQGCIVIEMMNMIISDPDGLQTLFDELLESPHQLALFCRAMCARILQVGKESIRPGASFEDIRTAQTRLWFGTEALIAEPTIYLALRKAGYLRSFSTTIKAMQTILSKDHTVELIIKLLQRSTISIGNPIRALVDIFEPGLLPIMLDALAGSSSYKQSISQQLVRKLGTFSYHPRLLLVLRDSLPDLSSENKTIMKQKGAIGRPWEHFMSTLVNTSLDLDDQLEDRYISICDNDKQHNETHWRAKTCSGCHMVVYCSQGCQEQDWNKRHRRECQGMRQTYIARKLDEFSYSQVSRAFHLGIAQSMFPQTADHLKTQRRGLGPSYKPCDLIVHLNIRSGTQSQLEVETMFMTDYDHLRIQGDCPAMEARVDTIIERFRADSNPNVILMDMHIGWCIERGIAILIEVGQNIVRFQKMRKTQ
ncbi:hypothetical protein BKA70DRAFT_1329289 [Coprinopsis sp. MPI-PUGE-AT-0042]|nr:hypothetical protein BKA70DRAFT_1329289 [Coprinopsis sp. MPI-PUGE-AT-0042]